MVSQVVVQVEIMEKNQPVMQVLCLGPLSHLEFLSEGDILLGFEVSGYGLVEGAPKKNSR